MVRKLEDVRKRPEVRVRPLPPSHPFRGASIVFVGKSSASGTPTRVLPTKPPASTPDAPS